MGSLQSIQPKTPEAQRVISAMTEGVLVSAICGLSTYLFTPIHPIMGIVFGGTSTLGKHLISCLTDSVKCREMIPFSQMTAFALQFIGGIACGVTATTLIGFPLNFTAGLILTGATLGAALAISVIGLVCLKTAHQL